MLTTATEFPVKRELSRPQFIAEVLAWLRGNNASTVLSAQSNSDLDQRFVNLRSNSGEVLKLREVETDKVNLIGFRHDLPDGEGRTWRTEGVLSLKAFENGSGLLRIRSQCIGTDTGAHLEIPRKPFLVKALLRAEYGGRDEALEVSDKPIFLKDDENDLVVAAQICTGAATTYLPIIYVSTTAAGETIFSNHDLEHLADLLAGCAHLVVEPSTRFSFKLGELSARRNAYRGAIGLALPGRGTVRRFYWQTGQAPLGEFKAAIVGAARAAATQSKALGASWSDVQEIALLNERDRQSASDFDAAMEELYLDEIRDLKNQIDELRKTIDTSDEKILALEEELESGKFSAWSSIASRKLGKELYSGEVIEWLKRSAAIYSERLDTHARGRAVLQKFLQVFERAEGLVILNESLRRAAKESPSEMQAILESMGFTSRTNGKHIVLEPPPGLDGIGNITMPRTPSDWRGNQNIKSDIRRALGIN